MAPRRGPRRDVDHEVLGLREQGRSFSAIAGHLGLSRSRDAYAAFHRALRGHTDVEREDLVRRELDRLELLEARIRSRDASDADKMRSRLEALEQMREDLK